MPQDAKFYLDLLQILACLKSPNTSCFEQIGDYLYGSSSNANQERFVLGTAEASAFLNEVYHSNDLFDEALIRAFAINPLITKLNVDLSKFKGLKIPSVEFACIPDGTLVPVEVSYLKYKTSYAFMAKVVLAMDRIYEFQGGILKSRMPWIALQEKYRRETGGAPQFINESTSRTYSAVIAAYTAKALEIGGVDRSMDFRFKEKCDQNTIPDLKEWQITTNDLVAGVNSKINFDLLANYIGKPNATTIIKDGIFYLKDTELCNNNLQGFALSGDLVNTFYSDGDVKNVLGCDHEPLENHIIDSRYQRIFFSSVMNSSALYGKRGRRLEPALQKYDSYPKLRACNQVIPQIPVNHTEQLSEVVEAVKLAYPSKDIYFRGQSSHYNLNRAMMTNLFLYGDENIEELSLPTAASRTGFNFDSFSAQFQMQIQGIIYSGFEHRVFEKYRQDWELWNNQSPFANTKLNEKHEKFRKLFYSYEWDLMCMAIGQHYGLPTHGLDITTDLNVAHWFALNRWYSYEQNDKEYQWYKPREKSLTGKIIDNPVIYILAVEKGLKRDLDQVDYIDLQSLRPERQNAFLHYGGWGLHNNICAQDVKAAVFLTKKYDFKSDLTTEYMFPSSSEDYCYGQLLDIQERAAQYNLLDGYKYIAKYKPEGRVKA